MNFVQIAGHLGADPEARFTQSGKKVTTLRVATRSRKGGQDETIWWRVTIWDDQFKNMLPHFKKGSAIIVFGEMQKPEIFTDREGKSQISLEITAVQLQFSPFGKPTSPGAPQEGRPAGSTGGSSYGQSSEPTQGSPYGGFSSMPGNGAPAHSGSNFDDEVPF